jgi:hypothetical protein
VAAIAGDTISILDGDTFVVSDKSGDVDASPHGKPPDEAGCKPGDFTGANAHGPA